MIGDYLVVALVFGIAVSFVAIIHHFWLRDAFKEETSSLDGRVENEREINRALNESSSMAGCQPSQVSVQPSSCRPRSRHGPFDPCVMTLVGCNPEPQKKMPRENTRIVTNTRVRPVLSN
jgi:hypothetical protein